MTERWTDLTGAAKGDTYDGRWEHIPADQRHGEADLVTSLLEDPAATVLDAGCGTGRVAIELARRGATTIGVDRDADLLATARAKAPELRWIEADLVAVGGHVAPGTVDLAVLAGNVLIFVDPGTESAVVRTVAATLRPGGLLVSGFQIRPGGYDPEQLDADIGLTLVDRWATWDRKPWTTGDDYQVSVHVVEADPAG